MPSLELKQPTPLPLVLAGVAESLRPRLPRKRRWLEPWLAGTLLVLLAAGGVAYLTATHSATLPPELAVSWRLLIIVLFLGAGVYAQRDPARARMGRLLICSALLTCVWLLNGSGEAVWFSVGSLAGVLGPIAVSYLLLAHPRGRLRTRREAEMLLLTGVPLGLAWLTDLLTHPHVPFAALTRCASGCPSNMLYLGGQVGGEAELTLRAVMIGASTAMAAATVVILLRRARRARGAVRRTISPVLFVAIGSAAFLLLFWVSESTGLAAARLFGVAYVVTTVTVPVAILSGLQRERLYLGSALTNFLTRLKEGGSSDVEQLMAEAIGDPNVAIVYGKQEDDEEGERSSQSTSAPARSSVAIDIKGGLSVSVVCDRELEDQRPFLEAVGAAALLSLERARIDAELSASTFELQQSRRRLLDIAVAERQRIQRDLHDSAQQRLVAMLAQLGAARQLLAEERRHVDAEEPRRVDVLLEQMQCELQETVQEVRAIVNGVYPPVLTDFGLQAALRAVCERCSPPAALEAESISRYSREIEGAVYFTCLEALQNVEKHADAEDGAIVRLSEEQGLLRFQVEDHGAGFDMHERRSGMGLLSMRDRIEAVGGRIIIDSRAGEGTTVSGAVLV